MKMPAKEPALCWVMVKSKVFPIIFCRWPQTSCNLILRKKSWVTFNQNSIQSFGQNSSFFFKTGVNLAWNKKPFVKYFHKRLIIWSGPSWARTNDPLIMSQVLVYLLKQNYSYGSYKSLYVVILQAYTLSFVVEGGLELLDISDECYSTEP